MSGRTFLDRTMLSRRRVAVAIAVALALLAIVETAVALIAPRLAPSDQDWRAAAMELRGQFRTGDLIVAAPVWADPVMRLHLGDLVPVEIAGRLDDARFGRVWVFSQRGADAPETEGSSAAWERRHGGLTLRRYDRRPAEVTFDALRAWDSAKVARLSPGRDELACPRAGDRFQCPDLGYNFVKPQLLEIGTTLRRTLYVQPVENATVAVTFTDVPLGRELAVGSGLHHVWLRKHGDGKVRLRVTVDGQDVLRDEATNRSGWRVVKADTGRWDGKRGTVRFEISADKAYSRHFGFAAEARR